jgi:anti-sigma factor RsiW
MDGMDCARLRELLIEHVDGLLGRDEAEAARAHLAGCAPCASLQEEVRRDFAALDAWEDEELPAGAFDRLLRRVDAAAAPAGPRRWRRLAIPYAAGLATAAAAAWAILLPGGPAAPAPGPGPAPAPGAALDTGPALATVAGPGPGPAAAEAAPAALSGRPAPHGPALRTLEFRDADAKTIRKFLLPPGVDPSQVQLVVPASLPFDAGDGVR